MRKNLPEQPILVAMWNPEIEPVAFDVLDAMSPDSGLCRIGREIQGNTATSIDLKSAIPRASKPLVTQPAC